MRKIVLLFVVLGLASFASATCNNTATITVSGYSGSGTTTQASANTGSYTTACTFVVTSLKGVLTNATAGASRLLMICNANPCTSSNSPYMVLVAVNNELDPGVDSHDNVQYLIPIPSGGGVYIQFAGKYTDELETVTMTGHGQ